jgi:methyl-accepting chemotaxis protein
VERVSAGGWRPATISIARQASDLVHELQKERGASIGVLATKGAPEAAKAVAAQRSLTDGAIAAFHTKAASLQLMQGAQALKTAIASVTNTLSSLAAQRTAIDSLSVEPQAVAGYYTGVIRALIGSSGT